MDQATQVQAAQAAQAPSLPGASLLSKLPTETISSICEYLDGDDISNFRLISRTIHAKSYRSFFDHHFEVPAVTFTREGLEKFVEFSKDPKISPSIRGVELALVAFPTRGKQFLTGSPYTPEEWKEWSSMPAQMHTSTGSDLVQAKEARLETQQKAIQRKLRRTRRRAYGHYLSDMNEIRNQSVDVELLAEALRNLPGLKSIWTADSSPNNPTVWGIRKIVDDLGMSPFYASMEHWVPQKQDSYDVQFKVERELKDIGSHSVAVVLEAIHRSGINFSGGCLHFNGVPQNMEFYETSSSATPRKTFAMIHIAEMKYLSRVKELNIRTFSQIPRTHITGSKEVRKLEWLHQIMANMTGLEALGLFGEDTGGPARYNGGVCGDQGYPFTITLPRLKVLWIEDMTLRTSTLIHFLELHSVTLQRLYLNKIYLRATIRMNDPNDRDNSSLVPWLQRNDWRVLGYCSSDTRALDYAFTELREGFCDVCGTRDLSGQ